MGLSVRIGKTALKNPVCVASGTYGFGDEMWDIANLNALGALFTKAVTKESRQGNMPPRIVETPSGMLNAIGLANGGVEWFIREKTPFLCMLKCAVFVNVAGSRLADYDHVVRRLEGGPGISGFEINVSCPNVKKGGISFAAHPSNTAMVVRKLRKATKKTLVIKLSPNVADIAAYARVCEDEGADAISLINTLVGMSVDIDTCRPRLKNITGGLSGPAIRPVGVAMVYKAAQAVRIPVIGIGGIMDARDALEYIIAGATAVQVGTANFVDGAIPEKIVSGIQGYLRRKKAAHFKDIVGCIRI